MGISQVLDEISFWNFFRHSWDVGTLFPNNSEFNVCLSVCLFAYSLTKIRQRHISGSGWDIFLKFFGDIPEMLVHCFQIILNFLNVCQSVSWLTFLQKIDKYRDISSSGSDVSLDFFGDIPEMLVHWFQMILNFLYGNQSGSWHTPFMKSNKFRDISNSWWDIFVNFHRHIPGMLIHFLQIIQNF